MKITVKVKPRAKKGPAAVVRARLGQAHKAKVKEVFPGETTGRRAGMVIVDLPDDLTDEDSETVLNELRGDAEIEYAEPARKRRSKS
jgi:hypothetical protein